MALSEILAEKTILAVDDEPDVLDTIGDLLEDFRDVVLHTATRYEDARQLLYSHNYDLVIFDIMGVQGFDLLEVATHRGFPAVMLTAHALNPEALKTSIELGARAYLPKEQLANLPEFLADILKLSYHSVWQKAFKEFMAIFDKRFGSNWKKSEQHFWTEFDKTLQVKEPTILSGVKGDV